MKRLILIGGLLVFLGLLMSNASAQEIVIKYAHNDPPSMEAPKHVAAIYTQNAVKVLTGGKARVDIYPAEQLGNEVENLEGVKLGTIQISGVAENIFSAFVPEVLVATYPYAFVNETAAFNFWDGPFGRKICQKVEEKMGVTVLGYGDNGFRHLTNSKKPIRTPEDMVGLKFRTRPVSTEVANIRALGADATPIAWGETYLALQQGVVDGQENPVVSITYGKLYEVQKYITLDGHIYDMHLVVVNTKWYQSLPPDVRNAVRQAVQLSTIVGRGTGLFYNAKNLDFLKQKGMTVTPLSNQEKEAFRKKSQPAVREMIISKVGKAFFEEFEAAAAKANKDSQ